MSRDLYRPPACMCVTWLVNDSFVTYSYVTCLIHMSRDSIRPPVCLCVTCLVHDSFVTHSYVTWLIHMSRDAYRLPAWCVWHDSLMTYSWFIHMWHDSSTRNMTHYWVMLRADGSCHMWMNHEWVMSESCHTHYAGGWYSYAMSHVACGWVMSHVNESRIDHEGVMSRTSCRWIKFICTYIWISSICMMRMPWLTDNLFVTHSHVTCLIKRNTTHSNCPSAWCAGHDSLMTYSQMTLIHTWHDSSIAPTCICVCDLTHSHVTGLIHTQHDSLHVIIIHLHDARDMTHSWPILAWHSITRDVQHS